MAIGMFTIGRLARQPYDTPGDYVICYIGKGVNRVSEHCERTRRNSNDQLGDQDNKIGCTFQKDEALHLAIP
jgi:hypothetical protein